MANHRVVLKFLQPRSQKLQIFQAHQNVPQGICIFFNLSKLIIRQLLVSDTFRIYLKAQKDFILNATHFPHCWPCMNSGWIFQNGFMTSNTLNQIAQLVYPFTLMASQALSTTILYTSLQFLLSLPIPISGFSSFSVCFYILQLYYICRLVTTVFWLSLQIFSI